MYCTHSPPLYLFLKALLFLECIIAGDKKQNGVVLCFLQTWGPCTVIPETHCMDSVAYGCSRMVVTVQISPSISNFE